MTKRIWITWEDQRRNHSLSKALGAELFQFDYKMSRIPRYALSAWKTFATLLKERPRIIFAQNPSILLALFAVNYGRLAGRPVIIDAHNAGVYPLEGRSRLLNRVADHLFRSSTYTIVTNEALAEHVRTRGGSPRVLPDPLPEIPNPDNKLKLKGEFNLLFICTWASDEPYLEVIKAASELDDEVCIYITGNSRGKEKAFGERLPENVVLTGFLGWEDYNALLVSSDAVIDLTLRENCLVCGAYEAVAAEKPLILSDTRALRDYFDSGALYTNNRPDDIADKINMALRDYDRLAKEVNEMKKKKLKEWDDKNEEFYDILVEMEES